MSVRKRTWLTTKGEERSGWIVTYSDRSGKRRQKSFNLKKDADKFANQTHLDLERGIHVSDADSCSIETAGALWIRTCENHGLERSTIGQYQSHLNHHINPLIGKTLLNELTIPFIRKFQDDLRNKGTSEKMIRRIIISMGALLSDSQERGLVGRNIVRDIPANRRAKADKSTQKRHQRKLAVGVDIPTIKEIRAIVGQLEGKWRPLLLTAIFSGLRASELRGLPWTDINLEKREITVSQRADPYGTIGSPKSGSAMRTLPIPPLLADELKKWKEICPQGEHNLVFPNGSGNVENRANIINRGWHPVQIKAGVVNGEKAKYGGLHSIRHFYASWLINPREDNGLGLHAKAVQERLGHSTINMTLDVYSHLFPRNNDEDEMARAQEALLFGAT